MNIWEKLLQMTSVCFLSGQLSQKRQCNFVKIKISFISSNQRFLSQHFSICSMQIFIYNYPVRDFIARPTHFPRKTGRQIFNLTICCGSFSSPQNLFTDNFFLFLRILRPKKVEKLQEKKSLKTCLSLKCVLLRGTCNTHG